VQFNACAHYQYKSMWRYVTVVPVATAAGSPGVHELLSSIVRGVATSNAHGQPVTHSVAVVPEYFQSEAEKANYSQGSVRLGPAPAKLSTPVAAAVEDVAQPSLFDNLQRNVAVDEDEPMFDRR
jgi:hypothetical protein